MGTEQRKVSHFTECENQETAVVSLFCLQLEEQGMESSSGWETCTTAPTNLRVTPWLFLTIIFFSLGCQLTLFLLPSLLWADKDKPPVLLDNRTSTPPIIRGGKHQEKLLLPRIIFVLPDGGALQSLIDIKMTEDVSWEKLFVKQGLVASANSLWKRGPKPYIWGRLRIMVL